MKEILAGGTIQNAFEHFQIQAVCTYRMSKQRQLQYDFFVEEYQVWQLDDSNFEKLNAITEQTWNEEEEIWQASHHQDFGWWRWTEGCNLKTKTIVTCYINGSKVKAYLMPDKFYDWYADVRQDFKSEQEKQSAADSYLQLHTTHDNFLTYCSYELGISTEKNLCAVATGLAQLNGLTMADFLQKTLG